METIIEMNAKINKTPWKHQRNTKDMSTNLIKRINILKNFTIFAYFLMKQLNCKRLVQETSKQITI